MSNLFPDDFGQLDRWDGVGTRFTQLDANRALDRVSDDPHVPVPYVAHDLPGVDPHGYIALGKTIFGVLVCVIIFGAGIVAAAVFGVLT